MNNKSNNKIPILKYQGVYRIFAKYDTSTNDFIRNEDGVIDESFDDYYMLTKTKDEIHHAYDDIYVLYIWSIKRGNRIIHELNSIDCGIIHDLEQTDYETIIMFNEQYFPQIDEITFIMKGGSSIHPTDISNLPEDVYAIPEENIIQFKEIYKQYGIKAHQMKSIYKDVITSKLYRKEEGFETFKDMNIPPKNFIYKNGLWDDLIQRMKEPI